jgi:PAS domain S-box-containing protein
MVTITLLLALTGATFMAGRLIPIGIDMWVLYFIPLVLTTQLLPQLTGVALAIGSTLMLLGLLDPKSGLSFEIAVINRALGLLVLVFTGLFLLHHRKTVAALKESENRYRLLLEQHNRSRAEAALHEVQERFKSIFHSSNDAIAYAALDGSLLEINDAFVRLTGRTREELSKMDPNALWSLFQLSPSRLRELQATGHPLLYETTFIRDDRMPQSLHVQAFVVLGKDGSKSGLAVVVRNITDRKRTEAELHRTSEELQTKNEALAKSNEMLTVAQRAANRAQRLSAIGQFAATIAHKIGTPLTALSGHVQLLMEDLSLPPKVRGRLQTVDAQIERTSRIIQDLLLYTRRAPPVRSPIDVNTCLRDCLALFRTECDRQHVACIVDLYTDSPPVEADQQHLQEAFNHLIENALQAMPTGGSLCVRTFLVEPSAEESDRHASGIFGIELVDTGSGINPDHLAQIFQPFFTTKQAGHGTGLGLAIVHETVRAHGGRIMVDSEQGKGTTFTIHLPISQRMA